METKKIFLIVTNYQFYKRNTKANYLKLCRLLVALQWVHSFVVNKSIGVCGGGVAGMGAAAVN